MSDGRRLSLLGGFHFSGADGRERKLPTRKTRALAAYLAVCGSRRQPRSMLASMFWGDETDVNARHGLRQALSSIRQTFGADVLRADSDFVSIRTDAFAFDIRRFEKMAGSGRLEDHEAASELYCGDFLAGQEIGEHAFDEWLTLERARLRDMARANTARLMASRAHDGRLDEAIHLARSLIRLDPFDEDAHRQLIRFYVRKSRRAAAIRHFRYLEAMLRRELGISPDEATCRLYDDIVTRKSRAAGVENLEDAAFVLEQLPQSVVIANVESRVVGWNRRAELEFGFTKDEMCERTPSWLYAPHRDQSIAHLIMDAVLENGSFSHEAQLMTKDGRISRQKRTISALYNEQGELIGSFGVGTPLA